MACNTNLEFSGAPESVLPAGVTAASVLSAGSVFGVGGAGPMDESFVVLPSAAGTSSRGNKPPHATNQQCVPSSPGGPQSMEESFVVLPQANNALPSGHDAFFTTLGRIFDIASEKMQVDHPMCLQCVQQLHEEIDGQVTEAEREVRMYERCLEELESESEKEAMTEEQFQAEMSRLEEAERRHSDRLVQIQSQLTEVAKEEEELEEKTRELEIEEEKYWQEFVDFQLNLNGHMEQRDTIVARIESTCETLELLRHTNVYNDAFHIWHSGPFGTINNFRLGRLPTVQVEWDEINAAWGQACFLLYTMAQTCKLTFSSYRIMPMGSHPKIADNKTTYELYGPVNPFWSSKYDKAMICFIACLQEFADFAKARDISNGKNPPFELPYKVEQDKIDGKTIRYSFNRDDKWTAALKLMLSDLKVALAWLTNNDTNAK